ncbi:hypothetical protein [Sorangium sp. So ce887]|uniref:hypothetical protein n=1 Tax=Sorangium sp. So ce887 TaxID=3133324 RepID=UPI003F612ADD
MNEMLRTHELGIAAFGERGADAVRARGALLEQRTGAGHAIETVDALLVTADIQDNRSRVSQNDRVALAARGSAERAEVRLGSVKEPSVPLAQAFGIERAQAVGARTVRVGSSLMRAHPGPKHMRTQLARLKGADRAVETSRLER